MKKIIIIIVVLLFAVSCNTVSPEPEAQQSPESKTQQTTEPGTSPVGNEDESIDQAFDSVQIQFNEEVTATVIQSALNEEFPCDEESAVLSTMRRAGVRGAVSAKLIDEPHRWPLLEVLSEDGKTYLFHLAKRTASDAKYYSVYAIEDMETGEFIYEVIE